MEVEEARRGCTNKKINLIVSVGVHSPPYYENDGGRQTDPHAHQHHQSKHGVHSVHGV